MCVEAGVVAASFLQPVLEEIPPDFSVSADCDSRVTFSLERHDFMLCQ